MLVLSRKTGESIKIAEGLIEVFVVQIRGDKVRLGVEAPKDIDVHRNEVFAAIRRQQREAVQPGSGVARESRE